MGFGSNKTLKRQLRTWHDRACSGTGRANLLEKAAKEARASSTTVPVVARAMPTFWSWHWL